MKNRKGGFTFIELLVVIAIIGILASYIIPSLTKTRDKAADAAALETARGVLSFMEECLDGGYDLELLNDVAGGGSVCTGGEAANTEWPLLQKGWVWIDGFPAAAPDNDPEYVLQRIGVDGTYYVACGHTGCLKNGPN